ncbi:hypothetical protein J2X36_001537 [Methylobacterium sp. BE186]|uniref:hypothetical protein n=1 Tax=Methylobacterium sp. BE186 TaxID=2817715 RepID=UPI00285BAD64|nr:hypothetical protein [Methylobacterium sp. BE186]MDR7036795.1 hypothetical protein [Methylobacterium sp. BE186]
MRGWIIVALLGLLAGPLAAQEAPSEPGPPSKADRQRNNAAKLAGLAAFVDASCPGLKADPDKLEMAVTRLGIDPTELTQGDLHLRAKAYTEIYQKDAEASCQRAVETFGESGRAIPGLIIRK